MAGNSCQDLKHQHHHHHHAEGNKVLERGAVLRVQTRQQAEESGGTASGQEQLHPRVELTHETALRNSMTGEESGTGDDT